MNRKQKTLNTPTDISAVLAEKISKIGKGGRRGLRRDWNILVQLCQKKIFPNISEKEIEDMLGKKKDEMDPEMNDYKAVAAYGVRAGWIHAEELKDSLAVANASNPLWSLASKSGKTFGESVAPIIAEHFLKTEEDDWEKVSSKYLYDILWKPERRNNVRIELKASSEKNPRFQQIRSPKMSGNGDYDYDILLCLGVYGGKFEWWAIPADAVTNLIQKGIISQQHNAHKSTDTDSYWVTVDAKIRTKFEPFFVGDSLGLREFVLNKNMESVNM